MKTIIPVSFCLISLTSLAQLKPIDSNVFHWADFEIQPNKDREIRPIIKGTCSHFSYLEIYAATQTKGSKFKREDANENVEELVIIKEGKAKVTFGSAHAILGQAGVALISPREPYTLENIGSGPLTYYVMRYESDKSTNHNPTPSAVNFLALNKDSLQFKLNGKGGTRAYFNRPTVMCENLEIQVVQRINKGLNHEPRKYIDNEIILVMAGATEMDIEGKNYFGSTGDLYFIKSYDQHDIGNATEEPCTYFSIRWR